MILLFSAMKRSSFLILLLPALSFLAGCAATPASKISWDTYEDALYQHFKAPVELSTYKAVLESVIENARIENTRVPPGVFAELGYLLLRENRADDAARYFQLERNTWGESQLFMRQMVDIARGGKFDKDPLHTLPAPATTEGIERDVILETLPTP